VDIQPGNWTGIGLAIRNNTYYNFQDFKQLNCKTLSGMKYNELWKILKKAGWKQIHGRKHDLAVDPRNSSHLIPVPRHKGEVPAGTADSILKEAGLK